MWCVREGGGGRNVLAKLKDDAVDNAKTNAKKNEDVSRNLPPQTNFEF